MNYLLRHTVTANIKRFTKFNLRAMSSMADHGIVPNVLSYLPKGVLQVNYSSGVSANKGNILTPTLVQDRPNIIYSDADPNALYTLLLTDPDAPSRNNPEWAEWHHWLKVNIPGNDLSKGDEVYQYIGSGPPKDSGLHRYIFLLFPQAGQAKVEDSERRTNTSADNRGNQKTSNIVEKYSLKDAVAVNIYQAEYDSYVDKLYKQIGF